MYVCNMLICLRIYNIHMYINVYLIYVCYISFFALPIEQTG